MIVGPVIGIRQNGRGGANNEEDGQSRGGPARHFVLLGSRRVRPMRSHRVAAYSDESGGSQECAVLFAQFGGEKRFFVMAIT